MESEKDKVVEGKTPEEGMVVNVSDPDAPLRVIGEESEEEEGNDGLDLVDGAEEEAVQSEEGSDRDEEEGDDGLAVDDGAEEEEEEEEEEVQSGEGSDRDAEGEEEGSDDGLGVGDKPSLPREDTMLNEFGLPDLLGPVAVSPAPGERSDILEDISLSDPKGKGAAEKGKGWLSRLNPKKLFGSRTQNLEEASLLGDIESGRVVVEPAQVAEPAGDSGSGVFDDEGYSVLEHQPDVGSREGQGSHRDRDSDDEEFQTDPRVPQGRVSVSEGVIDGIAPVDGEVAVMEGIGSEQAEQEPKPKTPGVFRKASTKVGTATVSGVSTGAKGVWGAAKMASGYSGFNGMRKQQVGALRTCMGEKPSVFSINEVPGQRRAGLGLERGDAGDSGSESGEDFVIGDGQGGEATPLLPGEGAGRVRKRPKGKEKARYKQRGVEFRRRTGKADIDPNQRRSVVLHHKRNKKPKIHVWQNTDGTLALPNSTLMYVFVVMCISMSLYLVADHKFSKEKNPDDQFNPTQQNALGAEMYLQAFMYAMGEALKGSVVKLFGIAGYATLQTILSGYFVGKTANTVRRARHNWKEGKRRDQAYGLRLPSRANPPPRAAYHLQRASRGADGLLDPRLGNPINDSLLFSWTTFVAMACYRFANEFNASNDVNKFLALVPGNPGPFPAFMLEKSAQNYALTKAFQSFLNTWGAGRYALLGLTFVGFLAQFVYGFYNKRHETKLYNRMINHEIIFRHDGTMLIWITPTIRLKILDPQRADRRVGDKVGTNATLTRYLGGRKYKEYFDVGTFERIVEVMNEVAAPVIQVEPVAEPEQEQESVEPYVPTGGVPMLGRDAGLNAEAVTATSTVRFTTGRNDGEFHGGVGRAVQGALQQGMQQQRGDSSAPLLGGAGASTNEQPVQMEGSFDENGNLVSLHIPGGAGMFTPPPAPEGDGSAAGVLPTLVEEGEDAEGIGSNVMPGDVSPVGDADGAQQGSTPQTDTLVRSKAAFFENAGQGQAGEQVPASTYTGTRHPTPYARRFAGAWDMNIQGGPHTGGTTSTSTGLPPTREEAERIIAEGGGVGGQLQLGSGPGK